MTRLHFPHRSPHPAEPVRGVNEILASRETRGRRAADAIARVAGSWPFIIVQTIILAAWAALNVMGWVRHWDPYPFILMNLVLSLQAAYTAPLIMMSQNRQTERDRIDAHQDYLVNQRAEGEIRTILEHLAAQDQALELIYAELVSLRGEGWEPRDVPTPPGDDAEPGDAT